MGLSFVVVLILFFSAKSLSPSFVKTFSSASQTSRALMQIISTLTIPMSDISPKRRRDKMIPKCEVYIAETTERSKATSRLYLSPE